MLTFRPDHPLDELSNGAPGVPPYRVGLVARARATIVTRYRPTSVLQLLLIGFALVVMPMGAGLVIAFVSVDLLSKESEQAVLNAARAVKSGEQLGEQVTQIERQVRQYLVLGDRNIYRLAQEQREVLRTAASTLLDMQLTEELRNRVTRLLAMEASIFEVLDQAGYDSPEAEETTRVFGEMATLTRGLSSHITWQIAHYTEQLGNHAARLQTMVAWLATSMIILALGLAAWVAILLARPIRQVEHAIRRLGGGDFHGQIRVQGPRDLEDLGARLDWLRQRLLELEEQKTNFLRHVSHELKTPLTAIREGSELLMDEVPGPLTPDQGDVAEILRDNGLRLQRLIEDLLSYSMAPPAVSRVNSTSVELAALIRQVALSQEIAGRAKGLRLVLQLEPVALDGDEEKLRSILDNLLSNAIKYSPKNGTVELSLSASGDTAVIDVLDEGPGVPASERERVFEAFYQGSAPYLGHVKGTGLGLALARDYVMAHKGSIRILNAKVGARFQIRLPMPNREAN